MVPDASAEEGVTIKEGQNCSNVTIQPDADDNIQVNFVGDSPLMVREGMESVTVMLELSGMAQDAVKLTATPRSGTATGEPWLIVQCTVHMYVQYMCLYCTYVHTVHVTCVVLVLYICTYSTCASTIHVYVQYM